MSVRRWLFFMLTIGSLVLAAAVPAGAASTRGWRVFATVSPHNIEVQFNAVTAISRNQAWAVGPAGPSGEIVEHWNGRSWRQLSVPGALLKRVGTLSYVSAISARDVWAMDISGSWLHYNGSRWSAGKLPVPRGAAGLFMESLAAAGPHAMWAIGWDTKSKYVPYAAYYNGSTWKARTLPVPSAAYIDYGDLSVVSAKNIWALLGNAASLPSSNVLMHWNGHRWSRATLPSSIAKTAQLTSLLALRNGNVWVGGFVPHGSGATITTTAVVARLAGRSWRVTGLPAARSMTDTSVAALTSDGAGGVWAGGSEECCGDLGPVWHYQSGKWSSPVAVPDTLDGRLVASESLALIPGTTAVWGVGGEYGAKAPNHEIGVIISYGKV